MAMPGQRAGNDVRGVVRGGDTPYSSGEEAVHDFSEIVARYETPLLRYAGQILGARTSDAEDVVQETFLRFHRHRTSGDPAGIRNLGGWLFRVAHNLALDAARKRNAGERARDEVSGERAATPDEGLAGLVRREAGERALAELARLPEDERQVILLRIIQDMNFRDIAEVTGLSIGNVSYKMGQGLREVARRMREAGVM
ncbi:MAG: sigma-70 family RNA polymerase sigma factor [Planctomycetota bacterium]